MSDTEDDGDRKFLPIDEDPTLMTDLFQLFKDSTTLRSIATKVKDVVPENVILQYHESILAWLKIRQERSEDTVTLTKFCDMLVVEDVERSEAIKAFHQLDCDGGGSADVETMIMMLETYTSRSNLGELGRSIRILQSCSLTPGFVDLYAGNNNPVDKHGARMLLYLVRNRVDTTAMPFPYLASYHNTFLMRSSVLKRSLLTQSLSGLPFLFKDEDSEMDMEGDDCEKRTIDNCYTNIEVSSNQSESHLLRQLNTYWQSDGAARTHWIRLSMKPQVVIKHLSFGVSSSDQSYMPELVTLSVGHSSMKLREVKEIKIPNHVNGQVVLVKNMKVHHPIVQINIKRCHGDGCDTRVHGLKINGFKMLKDQSAMTVADASSLWYIQMLTSTVHFTLPQAPALKNVLMGHTRKALDIMPPLSLSASSPERPAFLNRHVLQEIENFAAFLSQSDTPDSISEEGLQIQLALNLARGSVAPLIKLTSLLISMRERSFPCMELLSKALAVRFMCWERFASSLTVKCIGCDGGNDPTENKPEIVLESIPSSGVRDNSSMYRAEEGKSVCSMVFQSEENTQVSKVKLQVAQAMKGHCHGLVFVYNPECVEGLSASSSIDDHLKHFSKYDFWSETEFKFSLEYREAGLGGLPDNPVAFFKFEQDSDELEVQSKWNAVGRYFLVKFFDVRPDDSKRMAIASVKFFGISRPPPWSSDVAKLLLASNNPKKTSCSVPEIVHVILTFLMDIGVDQMKKKVRASKAQTEFLDMTDIDIMALWTLHLKCSDCYQDALLSKENSGKAAELWQHSSLLTLHLIHGLIPALATSKATTQLSRDNLFQELCSVINDTKPDSGKDSEGGDTNTRVLQKQAIAKQIIVDGAPLFFPDKDSKRNEMFKLLNSFSDRPSQPSMPLIFQSLCQYFSTVDPKGLLDLPSSPEEDFSPPSALNFLKSLLAVACQEANAATSLHANSAQQDFTKDGADVSSKIPQDEVDDVCTSPNLTFPPKNITDGAREKKLTISRSVSIDYPDESIGTQKPDPSPQESETDATKSNFADKGDGLPKPSDADKTAAGDVSGETDLLSSSSGNDKKETSSADEKTEDGDTVSKSKEEEKKELFGTEKVTYLMKLTSSLQTAFLTWCWQHLSRLDANDNKHLIKTISNMVASYTGDLMENSVRCLESFKCLSLSDMRKATEAGEPSLLCHILRQHYLFLSCLVDKLQNETRVSILQSCKKFIMVLSQIVRTCPQLFILNEGEKQETEETVLRTWEVESPHDYRNHSNITQTFHCPGANKFVVNFDPRCETERKYDYLEFVDAKGLKMRFDHRVDMPKWPLEVTFSGPHVNFLFHSDSSNTEWGYKFKVSAKGTPDKPLPWMVDLKHSLVKVLGQLSGSTLASNPSLVEDSSGKNTDDGEEQDILRSDLWTSLFRGGYRVGTNKLQRSLSGRFMTGDDSEVHSFLLELVSQADTTKTEDMLTVDFDPEFKLKKQVTRFLTKCKEADPAKAQVKPGGPDVDKALISLFVGLVWHCQQLREDIDKFVQAGDLGEVSEGILKAYTLAQSVRIQLAGQRQQWKAAEDRDEDQDPAALLSSKSMFLLKFSGLTKVQLKNEMRSKFFKQLMMKKAGNKPVVRNEVMDKYPSFKLVMEFVQDPAWTSQRVDQLLQERTGFASATRDVYMFSAEVVRIFSDGHPFQVPVVLYLQEMFSYQTKFGSHYADGLDGCGLEQESQVRLAFYALVRILVDAFNKPKPIGIEGPQLPAYDVVRCCLLHLLDIQWQPYDLSFVRDLRLPELYFSIAKATVKMRDLNEAEQTEEEELKDYEQAMEWFAEVNGGLKDWDRLRDESEENSKPIKMFIARFSDVLDVEISCDGCNMTLPGRRYRCLQCVDMDLCTSCFSGGVEPEEHRDDHEIVHLVYKCNHCQAFIMGKRIHCNMCDDFDLCLGCHTKGKFPSGHSEDHNVTTFPMVKLKTNQSSSFPLQSYLHQHAWLLYTSLTLTLSDLVNGQDKSYSFLDPDYLRTAGELHAQCVSLATKCLQQDVDVEKEKTSTQEVQMEQNFARHSQERVMGLLGAVMPLQEKQKVVPGFNFWMKDFLNLLLRVSKGEHSHELNTQHLALRLMGRLLLSTEVPVPATPPGAAACLPDELVDQDDPFVIGKETINHLFSYGAKEFERHGLEWACSVARMLELLFASPQWRPSIASYISQCVQNLHQKVDMTCIFPMFVVAGFPEVLTTGTLVEYNETSDDVQKGVVLKHFPDKYQTLVVNLTSRKRHTIKDQQVSCYTESPNQCEPSCPDQFVNYIIKTVAKMKNASPGEEMSIEVLWAVSLALKVVDRCLRESQEVGPETTTITFIQALVFLACKGTALNRHWLLKDLEVLSLIWYTQNGSVSKKKMSNLKSDKKKRNKSKSSLTQIDDTSDDDKDSINKKMDIDSSDEDCEIDEDSSIDSWETASGTSDNCPEDTKGDDESEWESLKVGVLMKELLEHLSEKLNFDRSVLVALVSMSLGDTEEILKAITENATDKEAVKDLISAWKAKEEKTDNAASDVANLDMGITVPTPVTKHHKTPRVAEEEKALNLHNLFTRQDKLDGAIQKKERAASAKLFQGELEEHGRSGSRDYLLKINMAMCVLYARQTLTNLLAQWPDSGPAINSSLLGCKDVRQIPCVLDLLYKTGTRDCFSKVVDRVIHLCDASSLVAIAHTAAQFMEDGTLSSSTRESAHDYGEGDRKRGNIKLSGASYLSVTFDSRCSTGESETLSFSTRSQMDRDVRSFSGSTRDCWTSFHLPGDTLYYKFSLEDFDSDSPTYWGYKFTVTAGTRDSFETGYTILETVLSSAIAHSLPLGQLWTSLVYVAVKQSGSQRLKAIHLMLKILSLQHRNEQELQSKTTPDIDLCILRPLWVLYESLTPEPDDTKELQPAVVGALTDFFLRVEELALEWALSESYLVSLIDPKQLEESFMQALKNVARVSSAIQWPHAINQVVLGPKADDLCKAISGAMTEKA